MRGVFIGMIHRHHVPKDQPMKRKQNNILRIAENIVHGARRKDYGTPLDNHTRTAEGFNWYFQKRFPDFKCTAEDVCILNIIQKISRTITTNRITTDFMVDTAGYAANIELVIDERMLREYVKHKRKGTKCPARKKSKGHRKSPKGTR